MGAEGDDVQLGKPQESWIMGRALDALDNLIPDCPSPAAWFDPHSELRCRGEVALYRGLLSSELNAAARILRDGTHRRTRTAARLLADIRAWVEDFDGRRLHPPVSFRVAVEYGLPGIDDPEVFQRRVLKHLRAETLPHVRVIIPRHYAGHRPKPEAA